ncbi:MAG: asparagine synthase (glutamine-hydrolyzing) [Parasporobacterium sp.]|nr:asparagine synthase (glutamine-hydrolyzing) [Lachnospiraceae bacterium]MBR3642010.1 asparagine synthase (glutamine-hydrolyzing) [Parasporobacterium sp.]
MCGIAGYVSENKIEPAVLKAMTERIAHRGPDGEGFFVDDKCGLGHRRLAIIDLKTGDQPIYNEDKTIVVVFNGEIYNFQTLRQELEEKGHRFQTQTDTEVLVHGYEEWGGALTEKLRGMYAFAIWDTVKESLFLARDKWGIKPLYYYQTDHSLLFASEIKAFLDHPDFQKQLNEEILAAYLCFNSVPTKETLFKNVFRLEPGHRMMYQAGKITIEKFFELDLDDAAASKTYDPEAAAQEIRAAMEDSVKAHGFADVEIGGFLSSGIDSSYLVSLAKPDKTFTVGYDDPKYDEISYAKDLAEKLQIKNFSRTITKEDYIKAFPDIVYHMDEPLADPSAIALYFVAETAAKQVKVVTSGEGADELFGGYLTYREEIDQQGYMKIPFPLRRAASAIAGLFPEFPGRNFIYRRGKTLEEYYIGLGRVFEDKEAVSILKNKTQISTREILKPYYKAHAKDSNLVKRQIIDYYFWLVRDFLHAVDRNTMMFGLEARTPFLDDAVYSVARTLPQEAKINKTTTKPALRLAASKVIPNEAYKKKKLGFPVPLREWIREEDLYQEIKRAFNSPAAARFFDVSKINRLLEQHKSGKKDCYKKVWTIYTFLVWYEQFFE